MFTSFGELMANRKNSELNKSLNKLGQELNRDIVEQVKTLDASQSELRKELNKERIKALNLKLIQGGKE